MNRAKCLVATLTLLQYFATIQGCTQRNITCEDIKSDKGYKIPHTCPGDSTIHIKADGYTIAYAKLMSDPGTHRYNNSGMKIDGSAFYNQECITVIIKCTFLVGNRAKDSCLDYKIMEATKEPGSSNPPQGPTTTNEPVSSNPPQGPIIGAVVALLFTAAVIILMFRQRIRDFIQITKKKAPDSCCSRDSEGTFQNGNHGRDGNPSRIEMGRPAEHEDNERNKALEDDAAQSSDLQDGEPSVSQDNFVTEDETRVNGGTNVPDEVPSRRDMQRNQRDDPGGANRINTSDTVKIEEMQNGGSHGGREPEDDEQTERSERKQLLPVLEGANPDSDMTGEATVLVDKSCSSPDPGSKHSIALDTGVKSARYMKNPGKKY